MSVRDIFLFAAVGISLPFCFLRPVYGIVVWTLLGFLNPQSFLMGLGAGSSTRPGRRHPYHRRILFAGKVQQLVLPEMCSAGSSLGLVHIDDFQQCRYAGIG